MDKLPNIKISGPLTPFVEGIYRDMRSQGYVPLSAVHTINMVAHLSRWMVEQGLALDELRGGHLQEFLTHRREIGYKQYLSWSALRPVLRSLAGSGVTIAEPPAETTSSFAAPLGRFEHYLANERGLTKGARTAYCEVARCFLTECFDAEPLVLSALSTAEVSGFIVRASKRFSVSQCKHSATALRAFLRYLYLCGDVSSDLAASVPSVAQWRMSALPLGLLQNDVAKLLRSCDRRTTIGRRDYAVLLLLVRLGLRAGEVAALELDDVDWAAGELVVRGKGRKECRLPLPPDVGEALAAYLRRGRPRRGCRCLFMGAYAPYRGLQAGAVSSISSRAFAKAKIHSPRRGSHVLRHTAATEMLRSGSSLSEIAQVLRHEHIDTTAIYAKVDHGALRELVQPWPGGEQ